MHTCPPQCRHVECLSLHICSALCSVSTDATMPCAVCLQIPGVSKLEKRLEDLSHRWDGIKAGQPGVKGSVEPIQVGGLCIMH